MNLKALGIKVRTGEASSGIKLMVLESPGKPVALMASLYAGSRFDPVGREGLSHLTEHMITAGSKDFPTKDKMAQYFERFGGTFSANTGPEVMNVSTSVATPSDLAQAVYILSQLLTKPLLAPAALESEKGAVLKEIGVYESSPAKSVWDLWQELLFQETALGHKISGNQETVKAVRLNDVEGFYRKHISGGHIVITAGGGITLEDLKREVDKQLELNLHSQDIGAMKPLPAVRKMHHLHKHYPGKQTEFAYGFRTPRLTDKATPALRLIAAILGGGRASSLSRMLRYERGLIYVVASYSITGGDHGSWAVRSSCSKSDLEEVTAIINGELERVMNGGITAEELEFAKERLIKSKVMQLQSTQSLVDFHFKHHLFSNEVWELGDYCRETQAVTLEDISALAKQYLDPTTSYLVTCGD